MLYADDSSTWRRDEGAATLGHCVDASIEGHHYAAAAQHEAAHGDQ